VQKPETGGIIDLTIREKGDTQMTEKKIKKGCLVRLDPTKCFTTKQGGGLRYPLSNSYNDERGTVEAGRPTTREEQAQWRVDQRAEIAKAREAGEDTFHIARDSAGESRLPPQYFLVRLHRDRVYTVLRARARVRLGWGNPTPGLIKLQCTHTGEEAYVKRHLVEAV
jgi:hypothetical protein